MTVVLLILAAAAVVVIALVAVGGVTNRLFSSPATVRFDLAEAGEFVASALADDVTARLSFEDVRRLLLWRLQYLDSDDLTDLDRYSAGDGLIVVADDETLRYLCGRAASE